MASTQGDVDAAMSAATPAARLQELALDGSTRVREAVAQNPSSSDELVLALLEDRAGEVRTAAARNAVGRGPRVHQAMVDSDDTWVRMALAGTQTARSSVDGSHVGSLSVETELQLGHDPSREVRMLVAETTGRREVFDLLLRDGDPYVRAECALNPLLTVEDLERLRGDRHRVTRANLVEYASLRRLRKDGAQWLREARDRSAEVRFAVTLQKLAPQHVIELLVHDDDDIVRTHAQEWMRLRARPARPDAPGRD